MALGAAARVRLAVLALERLVERARAVAGQVAVARRRLERVEHAREVAERRAARLVEVHEVRQPRADRRGRRARAQQRGERRRSRVGRGGRAAPAAAAAASAAGRAARAARPGERDRRRRRSSRPAPPAASGSRRARSARPTRAARSARAAARGAGAAPASAARPAAAATAAAAVALGAARANGARWSACIALARLASLRWRLKPEPCRSDVCVYARCVAGSASSATIHRTSSARPRPLARGAALDLHLVKLLQVAGRNCSRCVVGTNIPGRCASSEVVPHPLRSRPRRCVSRTSRLSASR